MTTRKESVAIRNDITAKKLLSQSSEIMDIGKAKFQNPISQPLAWICNPNPRTKDFKS